MGYNNYVIKDNGKYDSNLVIEEFDKLVKYIEGR